MNLWNDFLVNDEKIIHKWLHYFPIYERFFSPWRNKSVLFLEIGVFEGGSLQMWKRFFGPLATVVGIDINAACRVHEEDGVHIRIGDQSDPEFLQGLIDEFGVFDIVLDDGSHEMDDLKDTFQFMYPKLSKNGIYMVEDLHTAYWEEYGGGLRRDGTFIEYCKGLIDELNADHTRGALNGTFFTKNTFSMSIFDSIVAFERGNIPIKKAIKIGDSEK